MYRTLPLLLLTACGVFGLSSEEAEQLAAYQQNAATYYDGGDLRRAVDQAQRGLEIDPDDYKLVTIWAWSLLRSAGGDDVTLQQSQVLFERLMDMRSMGSQSHQALLGYGLCLERVGLLQRQQVELLQTRLQHQALDPMERSEIEAKASEHEGLAESSFLSARRVLERLLDNGEELLLGNKALMEVNSLLPDYEAAVEHGTAYLVESEKTQADWQVELQNTGEVAWEQYARTQLGQLRQEEIEVRALLANIYSKMEQWALVVEQLNVVLDMDRNRSIDYYNRGDSLRRLGRNEEMKADFGTFLSLTNLPAGDARVLDAVQAIKGILAP